MQMVSSANRGTMETSTDTSSFAVLFLAVALIQRTDAGIEFTYPFRCSAEDFNEYYPCGNAKKFKRDFNVSLIDYDLIGTYCVGHSHLTREVAHKDWQGAIIYCAQEGGELIEFSDLAFWNAYKDFYQKEEQKHKTREISWIRASSANLPGTWQWSGLDSLGEFYEKDVRWDSGEPNNDALLEDCVTMVNFRWCDYGCTVKHPFICRMNATSAYYSNLMLFQGGPQPQNGSNKVGDRINLICGARAKEGLRLEIKTASGGKYTIQSDGTVSGDFKEIQIEKHIVGEPEYYLAGARCMIVYSIQVFINANEKLKGATVKCTIVGKPIYKEKKLMVKYKPQTPIVTLYRHGQNHLGIDEEATYFCEARLGQGTSMTIAVVQHGEYWGKVYKMDGRAEDEVGKPPAWLENLFFKTDTIGQDDNRGGNFITLNLKFKAMYAMDKSYIACYSAPVLEELDAKVIKIGDDYSHWQYLRVVETLIKPQVTYDAGLKHRSTSDKIPVYGCDVLNITCIGRVGKRIGLAFVVSSLEDDSFYYRNSRIEYNKLPPWITITGMKEYTDFKYGPTVNLHLETVAGHEFFDANFSCQTIGPNGEEATYKATNFHWIYVSLHPILKNRDLIIGIKNPKYYLQLTCEAQVGKGDTMTWEMLNHKGDRYMWYVHKSDYIRKEGRAPTTVTVERVKATATDICGPVIISTLRYEKGSTRKGVTFTCFAYDLSTGIYESRYSKKSLKASYELYGGGDPDIIEIEIEEALPIMLICLIILLTIVVGIGFVRGINPFMCLYHAAMCQLYRVKENLEEEEVVPEENIESVHDVQEGEQSRKDEDEQKVEHDKSSRATSKAEDEVLSTA